MMASLLAKFGGLLFFIRNAWHLRRLSAFKPQEISSIAYRGYVKSDAIAIEGVYKKLNGGASFRSLRQYLYDTLGQRCLLVATQTNERGEEVVIGMNMYYLNARDVRDKTIHEAFIGVMPQMAGQGVATTMRKIAIAHFKFAGFLGISSRISAENKSSLQSAIKLGFAPVEQYTDISSQSQRYYMVYKLQD
ncbi:hypothetical protein D3C87_740950 [compost metagenome]